MKSDGGSFIVARQWTYGEGHGLTDLVRIRNGEVCYWPNKGYGRFGAKVTMSRAPRFDRPGQFDPKNLYLADISVSIHLSASIAGFVYILLYA